MSQSPSDEELIDGYVTLRDYKAAIVERQAQELRPINDKMSAIEIEMSRRLAERGAAASKTDAGTAYVSRTMSVRAADPAIFQAHVQTFAAFDLMEIRPSKSGVEKYMGDHEGNAPPGVDVTYVQKVNFRRS